MKSVGNKIIQKFKKDDIVIVTESFGVGVAHIGKLARILDTNSYVSNNKEYAIFVKLLDGSLAGGLYVNGIFPTPLMAALV